MIKKLEITGVHMQVDPKARKYVRRKIGRLDRYLPRRVRGVLHAEVKLKTGKAKDKKGHTCEVILHAPHDTLTASESTVNIYAAIDIVEAKLQRELKRYKEINFTPRLHQRLLARLRRGVQRSEKANL